VAEILLASLVYEYIHYVYHILYSMLHISGP